MTICELHAILGPSWPSEIAIDLLQDGRLTVEWEGIRSRPVVHDGIRRIHEIIGNSLVRMSDYQSPELTRSIRCVSHILGVCAQVNSVNPAGLIIMNGLFGELYGYSVLIEGLCGDLDVIVGQLKSYAFMIEMNIERLKQYDNYNLVGFIGLVATISLVIITAYARTLFD